MASILTAKTLMFLPFIAFAVLATTCNAIKAPLQTVFIFNTLNGTASTASLNVHCKSKQDDLGWHVIPHGGSYSFKFHPNWFGHTLFFCRMEWPGVFHYFDIYVQERDQGKSKQCCWFVNTEGACRCACENSACDTHCLPWNPPK